MQPLTAISSLDGRYADKITELNPIFSEFGLIHRRVRVEVEWLIALSDAPEISELPEFKRVSKAALHGLVNNFSVDDAATIKAIERGTNHDVKAVEYWLKDKLRRSQYLMIFSR